MYGFTGDGLAFDVLDSNGSYERCGNCETCTNHEGVMIAGYLRSSKVCAMAERILRLGGIDTSQDGKSESTTNLL